MVNKRYIDSDERLFIGKYFKEVSKYELITQEKEVELSLRIGDGDEKALDELVKANLRFVIKIAKKYKGCGLPLGDLINEGNYGLIKAAKKFDSAKGFRFSTYAIWWITQSILYAINNTSRTIRIPIGLMDKVNKHKKVLSTINVDNIDDLGVNSDEYLEMIDFNNKCLSLDIEMDEDGNNLYDIIGCEIDNGDYYETTPKVKDELSNMLSVLNDREREIIILYFGLNDYTPMTLESIGEELDITKERVRQIKNKSIQKLRTKTSKLFDILNS